MRRTSHGDRRGGASRTCRPDEQRRMIARGRLSPTKEETGGCRAHRIHVFADERSVRRTRSRPRKSPRLGSRSKATSAGFRANGKYLLPEGRACRRAAVVRRDPEAGREPLWGGRAWVLIADGAARSAAPRAIATARAGGGIPGWRRCTKPVRSDASARPRRLQRSHYPRRSLDLVRGSNHAGGRHNLQAAPGGTPDSETKEKCKGRNGLEGWRATCRKCTGRDALGRRGPCPNAGGMTARKTGAVFAYRSKGHDGPVRGWRGPCPFRGGGPRCRRD